MDTAVRFVTPPQPTRGGRARVTDWDVALSEALRGQPGEYGVYGIYEAVGPAEGVRRRIYRGAGPWAGGRGSWSVVVRKVDSEWEVYVAFRTEAMGVAS